MPLLSLLTSRRPSRRPSQSPLQPLRSALLPRLLSFVTIALAIPPPPGQAQVPPPPPESGIDQQVLDQFGTATPAERVEFIHLYERLGNAEMVEALSEIILKTSPDDSTALEMLAGISLKASKPEKALLYTARLIELNPTTENRSLRVYALSLAGRNREALPLLKALKAESVSPVFPHQLDLAYSLLESGHSPAAQAAFEEILSTQGYAQAAVAEAHKELRELRHDTLIKRGDDALRARDTTAARSILAQLEADFPSSNQLKPFSARILIAEGRHSDALVILENLIEKNPRAIPEVQTDIGYIFVAMRDWDVARETFQTVLDSTGYSAESVAQARDAMSEIDLYQRLELGYKAAKLRDRTTVREIADWANHAHPTNRDVRAFEAKAQALEGDHAAARDILARLESETPPGDVFPSTWDLGEALYETGDFRGAAEKFHSFAQAPNRKPSEKLDAFFSLAQLRKGFFGQSRVSADSFSGSEGDRAGLEAYVRSKVSESGWRAAVTYHRDQISLQDSPLTRGRFGRQQGTATFEKFFSNSNFAQVFFGAADSDILGGLAFGNAARSFNSAWKLDVAINQPATDSLTLRALDARQHHSGFAIAKEISPRLQLGFDALVRKIEIQGHDFGRGFGFDTDLAYRLNHARNRTNVALAYTASFHRFDPEDSWLPPSNYQTLTVAPTSLAADLVDLEYHRHGIELRLDGLIASSLVPYASSGLHYRFDGVGFEYGFATGFEWSISSDTALTLDASYYSSGQAGNSGAGTLSTAASLRHTF